MKHGELLFGLMPSAMTLMARFSARAMTAATMAVSSRSVPIDRMKVLSILTTLMGTR